MRRLLAGEHQFGEPLPCDVFNRDGQLLAKAGRIFDNEDTYRDLINLGYVEGTAEIEEALPGKLNLRRQLSETGVLIADDNELMLDLLEKHLNDMGFHRVLRTNDGESAVSKVGSYRPKLVFLDIEMPRRNGLSALKELREEFPDLFICMLSAHSSVDNVRTALSAGASGFLVKPCRIDRLQSIIDKFCETQFKT